MARTITGTVAQEAKGGGLKHFSARINNYGDVFKKATGVDLFPGTINVVVDRAIPVKADFKIDGADINEPEQDLLFERCLINDIPAFRIRPFQPKTGKGGWGDHVLEISSARKIENVEPGCTVTISFFRDI